MSTVLYGQYMLISRPRYDEKFRLWFPYASISWYGNTFHYQQFNDFEKSFQTEEQALALASALLAVGLTSISQTELRQRNYLASLFLLPSLE